jgi:hypothetical protein
MTQRKKRVLYISDFAAAFTGFGKNTKLLLKYLNGTGKYEILNAAQGMPKRGAHEKRFPWKTIGVMPDDPNKIAQLNQDPNMARMASYGDAEIDSIVNDFKPDVIFSVNDTWGSQYVINKKFFNFIPTVCWNTFDSLPLLPDTVKNAEKIKHYWTWSDFARKEFQRLGHENVKNQYPLVNTDNFFKLPEQKIKEILTRNNLPLDSFIIGFVFRNQLRKLINTQIEAYAQFKRVNPEVKNTFLYTHTHYGEGWDISRLCEQYGVNKNEVLCTYICKETKQYFILPYAGQDIVNPHTGQNTLITTNVGLGVSDEQLNEIYNIFSLYSHPATSGACELPCVEAALTEKIITTSAYSFGEDIIEKNEGSIPMKFTFYTEHGTQFLKSQPSHSSMSQIFKRVYDMPLDKKRKMEQASRKWALDNYSIEINGKKIEDFIDSCESIQDESIFEFKEEKKNPNPTAQIPPNDDTREWIKSLYRHILDREVTNEDEGLRHWEQQIANKNPKDQIENYFRSVAQSEIQKNNTISIEDLFDKEDGMVKVLIVQPESLGDIFLLSATFESIRNRYSRETHKIYIATNPQYQELIDGNPFIDKWIPYHQSMDSALNMEGAGPHKGVCDIVYHPYFSTQRLLDYTHNGVDKIDLNLHN